MRELARTPHWLVTVDDATRVVRATRTSTPYTSEAELEESMRALRGKLTPDRGRLGLLLDLRESPFRNDDPFETTVARFRAELFRGWAAIATLVRTAVGSLQVRRLAREDGSDMHVFAGEDEALAYLASKLA